MLHLRRRDGGERQGEGVLLVGGAISLFYEQIELLDTFSTHSLLETLLPRCNPSGDAEVFARLETQALYSLGRNCIHTFAYDHKDGLDIGITEEKNQPRLGPFTVLEMK